ncbi:MAG: hypothetical protein L0241_30155 [Planctomycetia bacterium]|nr:hypothetical protein [Planctomycetia bacterium]
MTDTNNSTTTTMTDVKTATHTPTSEFPLQRPHPDWDSDVNAKLGVVLLQLQRAAEAVDEFVDQNDIPAGMIREGGEEFAERLRFVSRLIQEQLCFIGGSRYMTNEEHARWLAGEQVFNW